MLIEFGSETEHGYVVQREKYFDILSRLGVDHECDRQIDKRTDGRTDRQTFW